MPDKWVFDTVALSNFLLSDSLHILEKRYRKQGVITWETYDEVSSGFAEYPKLKGIDRLIDQKTFHLVSLSRDEHKIFLELIGFLGKGEASCIAFAKKNNAAVVTDDRTARRQCSQMEIRVTGTIGILKASILDKIISLSEADETLKRMTTVGFYSPVRSITDIV